MSDRPADQTESIVEPLNLTENNKERSGVADTKEEYDRILERLDSKIKKPLHHLRSMIESEIDRLKNLE